MAYRVGAFVIPVSQKLRFIDIKRLHLGHELVGGGGEM